MTSQTYRLKCSRHAGVNINVLKLEGSSKDFLTPDFDGKLFMETLEKVEDGDIVLVTFLTKREAQKK